MQRPEGEFVRNRNASSDTREGQALAQHGLGGLLGSRAQRIIELEVVIGRYRISYEYRANEGGSGEPIGVLAFAW